MEVIGKIYLLGVEEKVSDKFTKRLLVIETEEQYPQFISINFVQDKCDLLDPYSEGDQVKVSINLRGREWVNPQGETKFFNDIQGWKVQKVSEENKSNGSVPKISNPPAPPNRKEAAP